ncbi:MAG: type II toxin-antitoxin system VapC family toxin [Spirochaetota bacterium]
MILDTDVLIWYLRGNTKARDIVERNIPFSISIVTYAELIQGMKSKKELQLLSRNFSGWGIDIIHIDKDISSRAMFYMQEYALSHSLTFPDALIAATAVQKNDVLITANYKHYRFIPNLVCKRFLP